MLLLLNEAGSWPDHSSKTAEVFIEEGEVITQEMLEALEKENVEDLLMPDNDIYNTLKQILA